MSDPTTCPDCGRTGPNDCRRVGNRRPAAGDVRDCLRVAGERRRTLAAEVQSLRARLLCAESPLPDYSTLSPAQRESRIHATASLVVGLLVDADVPVPEVGEVEDVLLRAAGIGDVPLVEALRRTYSPAAGPLLPADVAHNRRVDELAGRVRAMGAP